MHWRLGYIWCIWNIWYFQLGLPTSTTPFWFKQWFPWSSGTRTGGLCTMHYAPCTMHYALCTMHYALCPSTEGIVGQEGLYVTGCYHLYLPNAPLPPLTGSCLPRKHQKYWRRRHQVCKICKKSNPSSTLQTLKCNQKKMLKGTNVSSSIPPFHLSHPFFTAVLLWAFNGTSPRIRILVFLHRKPHHLLPARQVE